MLARSTEALTHAGYFTCHFVQGLGSGFGVWGLEGFCVRVWGTPDPKTDQRFLCLGLGFGGGLGCSGFGVQVDLRRFRIQGLRLRVYGLGFGGRGSGFKI